MAIHTLSIDVETFSNVDLKKCGVYKYAESPDFEILLFGVSVDGGEATVYDLASGDTVPEEIIQALADDSVIKWAYNASFERVCLSVWLRRNYPQHFSSYSIEEDVYKRQILERSEVYSGVYGRASINLYAFNSNGNRGIACGLNNLQKISDGEPLGGKSRAEDDFSTEDDDDYLS